MYIKVTVSVLKFCGSHIKLRFTEGIAFGNYADVIILLMFTVKVLMMW